MDDQVDQVFADANVTLLRILFPFGKELLNRFTLCSLCIVTICILIISKFGFEGGTIVLIALVLDHCGPIVTFKTDC